MAGSAATGPCPAGALPQLRWRRSTHSVPSPSRRCALAMQASEVGGVPPCAAWGCSVRPRQPQVCHLAGPDQLNRGRHSKRRRSKPGIDGSLRGKAPGSFGNCLNRQIGGRTQDWMAEQCDKLIGKPGQEFCAKWPHWPVSSYFNFTNQANIASHRTVPQFRRYQRPHSRAPDRHEHSRRWRAFSTHSEPHNPIRGLAASLIIFLI